MSENANYTLWFIPSDDEVYSLTSGYVAKLSSLYGLPKFEPHVTLLGGVRKPEMDEMRSLAESLKPFQIRLVREVEYRDEYFRCLFLQAYKTDELTEAFLQASALFKRESASYFPHLSLAYGDLPVWKKQEMILELGAIPEIAFVVQAISLVHASKDLPIESWEVKERFTLA